MPRIVKAKKAKKALTKPSQTRQVSAKKPQSTPTLAKAKTPKTKDPTAYFSCLKACCQKGIKPKKISQIAHECKTNALSINSQVSAQKAQAVKQIKAGFAQMGKGLAELIEVSK